MNTHLFFIGDSFVNGTGDPDALGWVGRVCASIQATGAQVTFYNLGIRGDTSTQIAQRWQQEVQARVAPGSQPGFVFSFGANDVDLRDGQRRVEETESLANAQAILAAAQAIGPVLLLGSPPIADAPEANQRLAKLCQLLESLCQSQKTLYIPTLDTLLNEPAWMEEAIANDGAHPRAAGYQVLADLVLRSPTWQLWISTI